MAISDTPICVIGSNCFSGSTTISQLLKRGCTVVGINRSAEPDPVLLPHRWGDCSNYSFHQLDLNHDLDRIESVIRDDGCAIVINFAAQGMVAESWKAPDQWFTTNTVAMVRLHDRLREFDCLQRYVQISTPEVYGATSGAVDETCSYQPSTPYAASKAACDMSIKAFHKAYGFPAVVTRAATVCGPGQQLYRIIPRTILNILTGQKLRLEGGGQAMRDYIHISDVAEATIKLAESGRDGEIYHIATERMISIRQIVEAICESLGASFSDSVEMAPRRLGEDSAYTLDAGKLRTELEWSPERTVFQAIDETVAWIRDNLEAIRQCPSEYIHKV